MLNESTVVKEYDLIKPDIHEIDYLLDGIIKDCRNNYFHTFEYTLIYDIKFTNFSNNEEVNSTITHRSILKLKLNSMVRIKKSKMLEEMVLYLIK